MAGKRVRPQSSEVDAYLFIKENLKVLGWDTRSPARHPDGQVYTQGECLTHPEIKRTLGLQKPENVVRISDSTVWVIEAKRDYRQLDQAVQEAEDYAKLINAGGTIKAAFITGLAGNQADGYLVRTKFLEGGKYKPITFNNKEVSSLLSPEVVRAVMETGPSIKDVPIDEAVFLAKAEKINQILHLGAINKDYRARVMAALLLSLVDETPPNVDAKPVVLIQEINARAEEVLRTQSKQEFFEYVKLSLPAARDNHIKFKSALVQTIQELRNLNIRSAMNSGADVLGKFYEVFLKYGNGAKEIGIVLTPRHITQFAVDVMSVSDRDIVYDPCCGTGGFLIAAFDYVKRHSSRDAINRFKQNNLFGVDQESSVVSLAIVNMIFRGDGKNNIIEGNTFRHNLVRRSRGGNLTAKYAKNAPKPDEAVVTRVLMNPPFALKSSDEKEFKFIEHALQQMVDGGLLFCVLPYSTLARSGEYQAWRKKLLLQNSLLSVITLPPDLFYPVGVHTLGMFVRKGSAHDARQNVLWIRAVRDGMAKLKGKRLADARVTDDYQATNATLKAFLANANYPVENIVAMQKAAPIDFSDPLLELVPENYLDDSRPSKKEIVSGIDKVIRDSISYLIRAGG